MITVMAVFIVVVAEGVGTARQLGPLLYVGIVVLVLSTGGFILALVLLRRLCWIKQMKVEQIILKEGEWSINQIIKVEVKPQNLSKLTFELLHPLNIILSYFNLAINHQFHPIEFTFTLCTFPSSEAYNKDWHFFDWRLIGVDYLN